MELDRKGIETKVFLNGEWWKLCKRMKIKDKEAIVHAFSSLYELYSQPQRHYHDVSHIVHCLKELEQVRKICPNYNAVEMALWFHDAVYDLRRSKLELQSAGLALLVLDELGMSDAFRVYVHRLIMATTHKEMPQEVGAKYVVDIDLSSLGAPPEVFEENTKKIFLEYQKAKSITMEEFNTGRAAFFLGMMNNRPHIFSTEYFRKKYELQAIENLKRSYNNLRTGA